MLHRCIEMSRQRYREKGRRPDSNVLNRNDGNCSMEIVSVLFFGRLVDLKGIVSGRVKLCLRKFETYIFI